MDEWKDIPGFEGRYQINKWGDVISLRAARGARKEPVRMKPILNCRSTWVVRLKDGSGKDHRRSIASLMADTWLGGVPEGMIAVHLNGKTDDHRVVNIGIRHRNEQDRRAVVKLDAAGRKIAWYPSTTIAAEANFITASAIQWYCKGRNKGLFEGKYTFRYDSPQCKTGRKPNDQNKTG